MNERKYKYRKPTTQDEHLEALYEELSASPKEKNYRPTETVKDYLEAILTHAKKVNDERKFEKESDSYALDLALGALAFASIVFLFNGFAGSGDWAWLNNHRFPIRLWGIAFAAVFIGVSIERSSLFRSLWRFGFTKLVASIALSALIIFSTGKASSIINSVFPVDAAALPFTRAIVTGLLIFQYSYPLLIVVALFAIFHGLNAVTWIKDKIYHKKDYVMPPVQSMIFLLFAIIIVAFSGKWINTDFSNEVWPKKVYQLAHILDFNSNYECQNIPKNSSVVFIGSEQARILVDRSNTKTDDMESFVDGNRSAQVVIPQKFQVLPCDLSVHGNGR